MLILPVLLIHRFLSGEFSTILILKSLLIAKSLICQMLTAENWPSPGNMVAAGPP